MTSPHLPPFGQASHPSAINNGRRVSLFPSLSSSLRQTLLAGPTAATFRLPPSSRDNRYRTSRPKQRSTACSCGTAAITSTNRRSPSRSTVHRSVYQHRQPSAWASHPASSASRPRSLSRQQFIIFSIDLVLVFGYVWYIWLLVITEHSLSTHDSGISAYVLDTFRSYFRLCCWYF